MYKRQVHCCTVDPLARKEMWVHAQYFEDTDGNAVPGVFAYLPVTVLRPSFSEVTDLPLRLCAAGNCW